MTLQASLLLAPLLYTFREPENIRGRPVTSRPGMSTRSGRLTREEALFFLLTYIVVEKGHSFELTQSTLFEIISMAAEAESRINQEEGVIPHEVIETIAARFLAG